MTLPTIMLDEMKKLLPNCKFTFRAGGGWQCGNGDAGIVIC